MKINKHIQVTTKYTYVYQRMSKCCVLSPERGGRKAIIIVQINEEEKQNELVDK